MWHFRIWFSRNGGVGCMVGLDDLRGLFQPMILWFYGAAPSQRAPGRWRGWWPQWDTGPRAASRERGLHQSRSACLGKFSRLQNREQLYCFILQTKTSWEFLKCLPSPQRAVYSCLVCMHVRQSAGEGVSRTLQRLKIYADPWIWSKATNLPWSYRLLRVDLFHFPLRHSWLTPLPLQASPVGMGSTTTYLFGFAFKALDL